MTTTEPPKTESEKPALPPWKDSRRHFDHYVWTDREASEFSKWLESAPISDMVEIGLQEEFDGFVP